MALLLGPPSSGKTTLLLALAGKLDPSLKVCLFDLSPQEKINSQKNKNK
jgi:ABC-type multidrug transport system ATPase subunit